MITKITTHEIDGLARRLQQYKGKDNFKSVYEVLLAQVQDCENELFELLELLDINTASGLWLDVIGAILGVERLNTTDAVYRALIKAQIGINNSEGTVNEVVSIFKILTNSTDVLLNELDYASIVIMGNGSPDVSIEYLITGLIQKAVGAAIKVEAGIWEDDGFTIGSSTDSTALGDGFSSTSLPTQGGKLAKLL